LWFFFALAIDSKKKLTKKNLGQITKRVFEPRPRKRQLRQEDSHPAESEGFNTFSADST
jgi:hypothetical protein